MKIKEKIIISSSKYLNFVATTFENKNNNEDVWYSVERNNNGKTVLIAAIVGNKLVVTKEFRVAIGDYEWALPAGLVEEGDTIEETAERELKEETNLELESIVKRTRFMTNSAGLTNEVVSIVFAYAKGQIGQDGNEQTEDIETFLMDKIEVQNLMKDERKIFSAKAWLIFDKFVREGSW